MFAKYLLCALIVPIITDSVQVNEISGQNEIIDTNFIRDPPIEYATNNNYNQGSGGGTWLDTAKNALTGPAGQMVVHVAKEMISRSTGNSQILSLNLTNLLILVLLKALIFAAGLIGAGNWGQYARARSLDSSIIHSDEAPLFIGFLAVEGSGQDGCLNRAACRAPDTANEYLRAAKAVMKGAEMFDNQFFNSTSYQHMLSQMERSIHDGIKGAPCNAIYQCRI